MGFKPLEGDIAILRSNGVFKTCPLYEWNGGLFAKVGGGFVRLKKDGSTSNNMAIEQIETDAPLWADRFGRLATADGENHTPLGQDHLLLLGS